MTPKILVIDDEPDILKLIQRIITQSLHYNVTTTNNSLEVPNLLEGTSFDVILTDLKMPGINGMDILKLIKGENRQELVIMITAFGTCESAIEAMHNGVFDYITKPFRKNDIVTAVKNAVEKQKKYWRQVKQAEIFEIDEYNKAKDAFILEYIFSLANRFDSDEIKMSEASGLPIDFIKQELNKVLFEYKM